MQLDNSFANAPQSFSTVYGTLAVIEDKFFFGDSDHYFYRFVRVYVCMCICTLSKGRVCGTVEGRG